MRVSPCAEPRVPRAAPLPLFLLSAALACAQPSGGPTEAQTLFRFAAGGVVTTGPVVSGGRLWFITDNRVLYILTADGKAIGKRELAVRAAQFIACDPFGRAAVPDGPKGIILVNRAGQTVWSYPLEADVLGPPAFGGDGRLFLALNGQTGGRVVALSPNGRKLWTREEALPLAAPVTAGPGGGPLYALRDGTAVLLSQDGTLLWSERFPAPAAAMATMGGLVLVAGPDGSCWLRSPLADSRREATAGQPASLRLGAKPLALAAGPDGFYLLGADGSLSAVGTDGLLAWRVALPPGGQYSALAAFGDRVAALGRAGVMTWDSGGAFFRKLDLANAAAIPAISPSGTVFSGGADWIVYAYRFERELEALKPVPMPPLGRAELEAAAGEYSFWVPGASGEDSILAELDDIEKSLESGSIGGGARRAASYAAAVALGLMDAPFGAGARKPGPRPGGALPRVRACGLLGTWGSPAAVPALSEVFATDPDPAVRAAAAEAIARIGLDPDGEASRRFALAASADMDERTAMAVVLAIEELYRSNGALDEPDGARALVRLMGASYSRAVRARAEAALRRISASW